LIDYTIKNINGTDIPISLLGYINATSLCKAGNKRLDNWMRLEGTKKLLEAFSTVEESEGTKFLYIKQGGNSKLQGTYMHPDLAIQLGQWISVDFSLQVSRWVRELLNTGTVTLQRPVKPVLNLTEIDIEAEELEIEYEKSWSTYTNDSYILYVAYIGQGLIKVGYTTDIVKREGKHTSSETQYQQFRMLKLSSKKMEKKIHKLLSRYKICFNKQQEIYKPLYLSEEKQGSNGGTLKNFIEIIKNLLEDNDLKLRLDEANKKIIELYKIKSN
jgi:hypothetical protein